MQELMLNPAFQSGVLPALAAAVAAALFGRTRALVLVPMAGFAVVVWLAVGLSLEPMTARSKVVVAVGVAAALSLALDLMQRQASAALRGALAALAAAAALWVSIRVLQQKDGAAMWLLALTAAAWSAAMVGAMGATAGDSRRTLVAATVLAFAAGGLGLLGATASVAMMGIALGASCGIALLALLWRGAPDVALRFLGLPVATFAALGGLMASLTGELPGRALLPLLLIPLAVRTVPRADARPWRDAALAAAAALVPAALAVGLALWSSGGTSSA